MHPDLIKAIARQLNLDSRETAVFQRELQHVQSTVYSVLYPELRGRFLVPMGPDQPQETDETTRYELWDSFGTARIISHWAQDLPRVGVSAKEFFAPLKTLGTSYGYTQHEIKVAARLGRGLSQMKANAAREVMERTIDDIIFFGMPEVGTAGFANHPNVPIVSLTTGTWSGAAVDLILADLRQLPQSVYTTSKGTITADTLAVPPSLWALLQKPIGTSYDRTILSVFLANDPYIRNVEQCFKLETAGADGGPRIVCYKRDPRVFDLLTAVDYAEYPPERRGMSVSVDAYARICGVISRYPIGAAYADNAG